MQVVKEWKRNSLNFYISPHPQPANKSLSTEALFANVVSVNILRVHLGEVTERKENMYTHTQTHRVSSKQGLQDMVTTCWNASRPACFKLMSLSLLSQCNNWLPGCLTLLHPMDQDVGKMCISKLRKKRVLANPFFVFLGYMYLSVTYGVLKVLWTAAHFWQPNTS